MFNNDNNSSNKSSVLDVLSGNESVKVDVGLDWQTMLYLAGAVLISGTILILINKRIK